MAGNFSDWSPYQNYVQYGLADGAYAHGGFTMLAAGPPRLSDVGGAINLASSLATTAGASSNQIVLPVGIIQNFNLTQTRAFSRIFELGSERSYFLSGRTVGQIGLGRVYYHGASLLRILYAYFMDLVPGGVPVSPMYPNAASINTTNPHEVIIPPGYENIYLNLASDLFSQPIGLMLYIRDSNLRTLGALYFESAFVPNHSWAVDSQGVMIQESVGVQYERIVPVAITDVSLVTNLTPYVGGSNTVGAKAAVKPYATAA